MRYLRKKIIGILGGMGPESTIDLYKHIVDFTPANVDQDHIETIIYSMPQIPDRTNALLEGGEDPTPYLLRGIRMLEKNNVNIILIACNTAHAYLPKLMLQNSVPIIDMVQSTIEYIHNKYPSIQKIGLLATDGTIKTNLYKKYIKDDLVIVTPNKEDQTTVMECIYGTTGIKAGYKTKAIKDNLEFVIKNLKTHGAEAVILGCTELPLVIKEDNHILPIINPFKILAKKAISLSLKDTFINLQNQKTQLL